MYSARLQGSRWGLLALWHLIMLGAAPAAAVRHSRNADFLHCLQVNVAAVQERTETIDWQATAQELDAKSPLEIMDHVRLDSPAGALACVLHLAVGAESGFIMLCISPRKQTLTGY